ncbi:hypothetical protein B6V73_05350 [Thioclava sp. JM3]|nr:hypothetical protein B6V73_05350 [Thioclava sp. JM3]
MKLTPGRIARCGPFQFDRPVYVRRVRTIQPKRIHCLHLHRFNVMSNAAAKPFAEKSKTPTFGMET